MRKLVWGYVALAASITLILTAVASPAAESEPVERVPEVDAWVLAAVTYDYVKSRRIEDSHEQWTAGFASSVQEGLVQRQEAERAWKAAERAAEAARRSVEATERRTRAAAAVTVQTAPVSPGSNRALGQEMMLRRWGMDQWGCLDSLWQKESGWNHLARNPRSGAYGIPQSLPGHKMASHGADWQTNPATQIAWGIDYIGGRYGTPCGAYAHFRAKNWY